MPGLGSVDSMVQEFRAKYLYMLLGRVQRLAEGG